MKLNDISVYRQRLTIEATIKTDIPSFEYMEDFLVILSEKLKMTPVGKPYRLEVILPPPDDHGTHVHLNWTTSGVDIYTWTKWRFLTLEIYTCTAFDEDLALILFQQHFDIEDYRIGDMQWK